MNWVVWEHKTELHIVPDWEPRQHRLFECACRPTLEMNRALSPVWVHHARTKKKKSNKTVPFREPAWE